MSIKTSKQREKEPTLEKRIQAKLFARGVTDPSAATVDQLYTATVYAIKDIISKNRQNFKRRVAASEAKKVCYLCM